MVGGKANYLGMRTKDARHVERCAAHMVFQVNGLVGSVVQKPTHNVDVSFRCGPVES